MICDVRFESYFCCGERFPTSSRLQDQYKYIWTLVYHYSMCKKRPYLELFSSMFSCIRTEYGDLLSKFSYSVQMWENMYQKTPNRNDFYAVTEFQGSSNVLIHMQCNKLGIKNVTVKCLLPLSDFSYIFCVIFFFSFSLFSTVFYFYAVSSTFIIFWTGLRLFNEKMFLFVFKETLYKT